jgi:predicted phage baseplate assembly protein
MPLPTPILDDRSFQQLRDELLQRIPVYAPEWTDLLPSDPGVTLVELFAFLGENLLFRFNQIPDATKLAFLRLLDVPLRPSTPATTLVGMTTKTAGPTTVAAGAEAKVGPLSFSTTGEVTVLPV